jgi:predicted nucleic acid-binding protein
VLLVDTSVWIEVFRRGTTFQLESVADLEEVVTCLPVIQEVLQGFRDERAFQVARESLYALPIVESPLQRAVFDEAIELCRRSRQAGVTVRSSVDCLIAACALRHGLTVVHRDRDFNRLARISPLEAHDIFRH